MTRCRKDNEVWIYVYDLAGGTTSMFGLNPVYHTSIVINEKEIEYGPRGITVSLADAAYSKLVNMHFLGNLDIEMDMLMKYLSFLNQTKYKGENYNVMKQNCNEFTRFIAREILHRDIPEYLHNVPHDFVRTAVQSLSSASLMMVSKFSARKI